LCNLYLVFRHNWQWLFLEMSLSPPETITVDTETLACDGGDGPLGHPRVYLHMTKSGTVDCPYCGRHYVLAASGSRTSAGH
jgi:uncharacterized Zn-finger protein